MASRKKASAKSTLSQMDPEEFRELARERGFEGMTKAERDSLTQHQRELVVEERAKVVESLIEQVLWQMGPAANTSETADTDPCSACEHSLHVPLRGLFSRATGMQFERWRQEESLRALPFLRDYDFTRLAEAAVEEDERHGRLDDFGDVASDFVDVAANSNYYEAHLVPDEVEPGEVVNGLRFIIAQTDHMQSLGSLFNAEDLADTDPRGFEPRLWLSLEEVEQVCKGAGLPAQQAPRIYSWLTVARSEESLNDLLGLMYDIEVPLHRRKTGLWLSQENEAALCAEVNRIFARLEGRRPTDVPVPEFDHLDVVWRDPGPDGFYVALMDAEQLKTVGKFMRHCVGGPPYPQRAREGTGAYYVLFTAQGRPKFCLEVLLRDGRPYRIEQVKGVANRLPTKPTELQLLAQFIRWLGFDPHDESRVHDMGALGEQPRTNPSWGRTSRRRRW